MRATDIVRDVLDLIDKIECQEPQGQEQPNLLLTPNDDGELVSRFKQIHQILSQKDAPTDYTNSPNEIVTDIESVTTDVGGGPNGIKHPKDIRVKDPRGYE
jgi:Trp operon repressor